MKLKSTFCSSCYKTCDENGSQNKGNSVVKATASEYVRKSTIHGMAYVGDDERNKFERLAWLVMLACSVIGASYSIYRAYRTMKDNPIIESPSLGQTPRWEIPFPAVTVCPVTRIASFNFELNITYWPDSIKDLLPDNRTDLTNIEYAQLPPYIENLFLWRSDQNNYDILTQVLPEIEILVAEFVSLGLGFHFHGQKMITQYGACMTFNMYPEKTLRRDGVILSAIDEATYNTERLWSRDTGFSNDLPQPNYTLPLRSFSPTDFIRIAWRANDSERLHKLDSEFSVYFHAPDEVPQINQRIGRIKIKPGTHNMIDLTPHLVVSEGIEHYQPEVRQCYYYNERHLAFYKGYTQSNCETECFANFTLAQCKCVDYYLPHFNDTKLCVEEFKCANLIRFDFYSPDFTKDDLPTPYNKCNCFPSCTQLLYKAVLSETASDILDEREPTTSIIDVSCGEPSGLYIKKDVRTELHSISEFLSNCGGALGLFLGVSIFSIFELVYFCTVRLYSNIKKKDPPQIPVNSFP